VIAVDGGPGQLDDVTSPAVARQVVARFPRSRLFVTPNRGHASTIHHPFASPAVGVVRAFIRSGRHATDGGERIASSNRARTEGEK